MAEHAKTLELEPGKSLEKSYRHTVYCTATLEQTGDGKVRGKWCGQRWCLTCNAVRIARSINRYLPAMAGWDKWLVTLTVPNVTAAELPAMFAELVTGSRDDGRAIKRTDGLPFRALRKIECTYNPLTDRYHAHSHFVVDGEAQARALVRRHLARHPAASPKAQDARPCDDGSLREVFKYFTKIMTKRGVGPRSIVIPALDVIFRAMVGRRVFQPMGFTAAAAAADEDGELATDEGTAATERPHETITWEWMQSLYDWIDVKTGTCLTGYEPTEKYRTLIESITPSNHEPSAHPPRPSRHRQSDSAERPNHRAPTLPNDAGRGRKPRGAPARDRAAPGAPNGRRSPSGAL